jgi:hypothetical protein
VPFRQVRVGACGYVPSHHALSGVASQEPGCHGAWPVLKSPWVVWRMRSDQTGGKILSVHGEGKDQHSSLLSLVLFR